MPFEANGFLLSENYELMSNHHIECQLNNFSNLIQFQQKPLINYSYE